MKSSDEEFTEEKEIRGSNFRRTKYAKALTALLDGEERGEEEMVGERNLYKPRRGKRRAASPCRNAVDCARSSHHGWAASINVYGLLPASRQPLPRHTFFQKMHSSDRFSCS